MIELDKMSKRHLVTIETKYYSESKNENKSKKLSSEKFKGPDFTKIVSREKLQKIGVKKRLFPFLDLKYEVTRKINQVLN